MLITQQFIDKGIHTFPLSGKLERLPNGKKTTPFRQTGWQKTYTESLNKKATKLAGMFTGAINDIVAIDCDNAATYALFKKQDPDYKFHFISKDKPAGGGTIIYKYDGDIKRFSVVDNDLKIDFLTDNAAVYLPTEKNLTKEPWLFKELPPIKAMPESIKVILQRLFELQRLIKLEADILAKNPSALDADKPQDSPAVSNRLALMLLDFVDKEKYQPTLFKIITPKSFRSLDQYVRQGHLHPRDVPSGRGSEYLSRVSAILGSDISVSKELYQNTMQLIYKLRGVEWEDGKLLEKIINPMIEERVAINGQTVWHYDKDWAKLGFIATAINGEYVESFFDDVRGLYYLINYARPYVKKFSDKNPCVSMLRSLLGRKISVDQYDETKQLVRTELDPSQSFGHIAGTDRFNLFRESPEIEVLRNPKSYAPQYKRPTIILKYFESLIPDPEIRNYVLRFIRTKFTTFKYSPVVLYFIGASGSGKDTFVSILGHILGTEYIVKPDTNVFMGTHNGDLLDKYIIHLDEYGTKLTQYAQKQHALGIVKSISGSPEIQIRSMQRDGVNYRHSATICLTDNKQALPAETDDRRLVFIKTPNRLDRQPWVDEAGGITEVIDQIKVEIMDFCYYLATEFENLGDAYVIAPETLDKETLILSGMLTNQVLGHHAAKGNFATLEDLGIEYGVKDFTLGWDRGRIMHDKLAELYHKITEGMGNPKVLVKGMKEAGVTRAHTTMNYKTVHYYMPQGLHLYKTKAPTTPKFAAVDKNQK